MRKNVRDVVLCKILIEKRINSNLTQTDIANRLEKPQSFVSKYETGERKLDLIEFLDVCYAIGCCPISIIKELEGYNER